MNKKTAIVTGASSGIGFAIAKTFLKQGYNVIGNARTMDSLEKAKKSLDGVENFLLVPGDIGLPSTAKNIFETALRAFGSVDVLINNAGIFNAKPFIDYQESELDALISTNLKGFVFTSQEAARHMIPRKSGHIINITASIANQPLMQVPASLPILIKGGLNHATKALALELAPFNIQVSAVAPGIIDTPLYTQDLHDFLKTLQPTGRIGSPKDIADAVLFLANSKFATGVILPIDGGMTAGRW